jgi:ribonuclease VapC
MVIDSSAILAILLNEPERRDFNVRIAADATRLMSAASYLEAAIVADSRLGRERSRDLKLFIIEADIEIVPVTPEHAEVAREAYRLYGRGNNPARLNYGDCLAYALARTTNEPLLFKGDDFRKTDLTSAA